MSPHGFSILTSTTLAAVTSNSSHHVLPCVPPPHILFCSHRLHVKRIDARRPNTAARLYMIELHAIRDRADEQRVNYAMRIAHSALPPHLAVAQFAWLALFSPTLPQPASALADDLGFDARWEGSVHLSVLGRKLVAVFVQQLERGIANERQRGRRRCVIRR